MGGMFTIKNGAVYVLTTFSYVFLWFPMFSPHVIPNKVTPIFLPGTFPQVIQLTWNMGGKGAIKHWEVKLENQGRTAQQFDDFLFFFKLATNQDFGCHNCMGLL